MKVGNIRESHLLMAGESAQETGTVLNNRSMRAM